MSKGGRQGRRGAYARPYVCTARPPPRFSDLATCLTFFTLLLNSSAIRIAVVLRIIKTKWIECFGTIVNQRLSMEPMILVSILNKTEKNEIQKVFQTFCDRLTTCFRQFFLQIFSSIFSTNLQIFQRK